MSDSSLYLALREGSQASRRRDTTIRWVKGRVVDTAKTDPTLPAGWVRVGMPYDKPETYVAGETPGLYTWQGAMVTVRLHPDGTLLSITDGQDEPGDERTQIERLGPAGKEIADAMNDAVGAKKAAAEVKVRADNAAKDAAAAARDAQTARAKAEAAAASVGTVQDSVKGLDSRITAAGNAAKDAAAAADAAKTTARQAAETAKRAEDAIKNSGDNAKAVALAGEAKSLAQAAQTLAGQANTKARDAADAAATATQKAADADTAAKKADANASAVKATADGAQAEAQKAQAEAQKAQADYAALKARQDASAADVLAAKQKADGAAAAAQGAAEKADKAAADALGARNAADQASAKMSSLDGKVTIAARTPLPADGQGKSAGSLWWVQGADGRLGQAFVWNGAVWRLSQAGTNFIGDKAIGSAQIGDASIGAAQIADASITDAKIGGLSVSKLMVTGGARMPQAVIDVITSDSAFLGAVAAHSVSVDPENMVREPTFASSPSSVWTVSDAKTVALAATVSGAPGALVTGVRFTAAAGEQTWAQATQKVTFPAGKRWVLRMTYRYNSGNSGTLVATAAAKEICRPVYKANDYSWRTEEWSWTPDASVTSTMFQLSATAGCRAEVAFLSLTEAVGATKLAPGSVTSDAIYASKELWAKLAAFASVTTDMLTAGKATITGDAVVGNLKGNNIFGSKIVGSSMYAYSESAESLNKKGLPYKAVDADGGDWISQAVPMTRVWANRYGDSDSDGLCTITSASDTEMAGKYTSRLDFTYNACWETYVDLPSGDVFDATLDFWVADTGGTSEMEIVLLRDGIELSRNRTLDGWQTISIANWKKGDAGTRRYYLRIFPLYSPTTVSFKNLKLWYRTVYDTSSIRLKGNSLLFRQSRPDDKGTNAWFRFTNGQMYAAGTNQLEYQRPLKSLVMPPHFIGTTNQQRVLQRNYWEWWPGKLQNDTEWFEYDAQDFRIGKNNIPQAVYSGLYWVTIQVTASSHYSSLWTTLLVELNPAGNWDLAVGNSVTLEPGVRGVKVSAAGLMQLRTNVRLYWHFAIRTPDMGSENGWLELNNMRLSAMYISN
uniref:Uncharacterized protein n=1 Tax=Siphoviridae sp. ctgaU3 TaxID=2825609 RepID=A0A8S5UW11_9CAUD|nr:MAG TPA: hypothetical protein [Siphoviridae sp. ctgaU3]